ncbi:hypothetical protein BD410DRAFT_791503 [Rickenella mellea]|uniref:Peroxisomal biogenesis factor 11 n=1 Tax=Rickenella mellea TaxID=50990 RepID=A0A4Y7PYA7_9AGAM|nr:hypothetical protein BD410DRAFT_791503 [Rickenella mellea]
MSRPLKSLSLSRLSDVTLGAFAFAPSSEVLDHAIRYLSTWSGSDKLLMIIQYSLKLIIPFLNLRARLQHKAGLRREATSKSAPALSKIASLIGDSRMLWRFWGLLPIYQWLVSLERMHPPTRRLLTIERLQGWSMIAYYPLEHLYYLISHSVIPPRIPIPFSKPLKVDVDVLGILSTRFWALYVLLQFAHLREDRQLLKLRERALNKSKGKSKAGDDANERAELEKRWDALLNEFMVNIGYLPLTVHWSLENGLWSNPIWEGLFGLIAGLASFRSGWKATALPLPASAAIASTSMPSSPAMLPAEVSDTPVMIIRD